LSPTGVPSPLFYLAGITAWNYFSDCLVKTSATFTTNSNIFGKVYFPRLVVPLSIIMSNLIKFGVQFLLLIGVFIYYYVQGEVDVNWSSFLLIPLLLLLMAVLGLGAGLLISSITTKYRDFKFLVDFGVRLMMYASPVVFPLALVSKKVDEGVIHPLMEQAIYANPMTSVIEAMKHIFMGTGGGQLDWAALGYTAAVAVGLLLVSLVLFSKVEKSFMDTV
jgi:lipopolysaccharide transport system permease protein